MKESFSRWDAADYLSTDEDITEYLNSCIEEDPGDGSLVRAALGDIARAKSMTGLAGKTGLTREGLYKALSPRGNPSFSTILKVSRALGVDLHFDIRKHSGNDRRPRRPSAA